MTRRILHVVTNRAHYDEPSHPTGLWLSELSHAWDVFAERGFVQALVSPAGGVVPLEPRALKWPLLDRSAKRWLADPALMALLQDTAPPDAIDPAAFAAIFFTGGHGVMWDFPDNAGIQAITRSIWLANGIVSAVCHGYCGLLNTTLPDGTKIVAGRRITGFSWNEEILAGVRAGMPYNAEAEMKRRGARYRKAMLPFVAHVETDGRLVTGQNPASARATARAVVGALV